MAVRIAGDLSVTAQLRRAHALQQARLADGLQQSLSQHGDAVIGVHTTALDDTPDEDIANLVQSDAAITELFGDDRQRGGGGLGAPVGGERPALTAAAISCGFSAGEYKSELAKKWLKYCQTAIPLSNIAGRMGHDEYTHYYYAQALYILGDKGWENLFGPTPEQAFFVKCDSETNPPDVIEAGQVITEIGIAPVKPAEFVVFRISQYSADASEVSE